MNHQEIVEWFGTEYRDEDACVSFVHQLKWPNGFICNTCAHHNAYPISTRNYTLYECSHCKKQHSLTAHTIMHKSRTPLYKWLLSICLVSLSENSINAVQLKNLISVTYKTAWIILHKIRLAISSADQFTLFEGHIIGKHEIFKKKSFPSDENLAKEQSVIIAKSLNEDKNSLVKVKILPRNVEAREPLTMDDKTLFELRHTSSELLSFELNPRFQRKMNYSKYTSDTNVEYYNKIKEHCDRENPNYLSNLATKAFSWLNDTFHGIGEKYAQQYLDEYCFRLSFSRGGWMSTFKQLAVRSISPIQV